VYKNFREASDFAELLSELSEKGLTPADDQTDDR
jgi:hypothetical protein